MQNDDLEQGLVCPSFNSYSSNSAAIAAKVCREFEGLKLLDQSNQSGEGERLLNDDDEFEFVSFQNTTDQVFFDDHQIGTVFPVFNRDLLLEKSQQDLKRVTASAVARDDDEDAQPSLPSSSSSEADELEAVPPGTYCVWMPKSAAQEARGKCKKSKSTGNSSSRRWSIRDLLRRSNSEGGSKNSSFVFLTPSPPSSSSNKAVEVEKEKEKIVQVKDSKSSGSGPGSGSGVRPTPKASNKGSKAVSMAHEAFYVRNKSVAKDGYNKRRSYLPYRQDLVGFFATVNAMSRTFPAL